MPQSCTLMVPWTEFCHSRTKQQLIPCVHAAFGTYVLAATDVACKVKEVEQEVVVFNPKKEVIALVVITWVFQIITLCALSYMCSKM